MESARGTFYLIDGLVAEGEELYDKRVKTACNQSKLIRLVRIIGNAARGTDIEPRAVQPGRVIIGFSNLLLEDARQSAPVRSTGRAS